VSGQIVNDYQTLKSGAQALSQFGQTLQQMGGQFKQIHRQLKEHCSGDESGIGGAIEDATSDTAEAGGEVFAQGGRVLSEMGSRTDTNTDRSFGTDQTIADTFNGMNSDGRSGPGAPEEPGAPAGTSSEGENTPAGAHPDAPEDPDGKHSKPSTQGPSNDAVRPYGGPGGMVHDDPKWQQAMENNFPKDANGDPVVHADPRTGWVGNGNDGGPSVNGRGNNCADCSRSFMASWYGEPTCAQRRAYDPTSAVDSATAPERDANTNIVNYAGTSHRFEGYGGGAGYQGVANRLQTAGPGSAAIVQVDWPKIDPATGQPMLDPQTQQPLTDGGHAFNAVNVNGKVVWVDMQTNTVSDSPINAQPDPVHVWSIALDSTGKPVP